MKTSIWTRAVARWTARYYLKRPDQADLILIKYPRLSDLWPALINETCYRLRSGASFRLTGLNIELTNRCNLSCRPCLRSGPDGREERDMDFETFKRILDQSPTVKTMLPFQWGEPLLHPRLNECIAYAVERGVRVMLTTNGTLLDEETGKSLIASGLSRLTVSFDGNRQTHASMRMNDPDLVISNANRFREIRDQWGAPCALDVSMVVDEESEPYMDEFRMLFSGIADRIQYIPRFVRGTRRTPCRELWRGVLVVLSSGDVTLCCADANGEAAIGNVNTCMPSSLFNSPTLRKVRRLHKQSRFPSLCRECAEYASSRVSPRFS